MCSLAGRVDTTKKQVTNRRVHTRLFYLGRTVIKGVYLDELEPNRGRNKEIELPSCDVICEMLTKAAIEKRG